MPPLSSGRLQNPSPEGLRRWDEAGGEHHEHQLAMFLAKCPPKLRTLAKPFARVTAQMGRGGGEHHEHQLAMFLAKCPP